MENSIFLAKILGPYCIIIAAGILFNLESYQKLIEDFCKHSALLYLGGILAFLFGFLIVLFHNVWVADWPIIITIFGWGGLIKGAWLILFPSRLIKLTKACDEDTILLLTLLFVITSTVFGIFLTFMGYFAA